MQKRTQLQLIKELRVRERRQRQSNHGDEAAQHASEADKLEKELENFELTEEEREEKEALVQKGFGTWSRGDFRAYTLACEQYGRGDMTAIVNDVVEATGKTKTEVREYHKVFWARYKELTDWEKIIDRIGKGEQKLARREAITKALNDKVGRTPNPWQTLTIAYGSNKGKAFTEEEDRFLVCMMQELGYGAWEQLKQEIRKTWLFRFDWFIKSRTPAELQRRCDTLVRLIEKENDELGGGKKRKKDEAAAGTGGRGGGAAKSKKKK
jgi:SWI/SNF-related matrix-associated actin-dependent regulator of chromatin subfamily A member 5